jgi:ABC-type transport system involved in multi-copper enzyme maturation permease subunit
VTPSLLIAGNFLREQRWFIVLLLGYVAMFSLLDFLSPPNHPEELVVMQKQLAGFALLFSLSVVTGALQIERRTRRIVAVLSKGISRAEYIAGFLLGSMAISAIYCTAMAAAAVGLRSRIEFSLPGLLGFIAMTFLACVLTNAIALFFATMLNPLFAMFATGATIAVPFALAQTLGPGALNTVAVAALLESIFKFSFAGTWSAPWWAIGVGVIEVVAFWMAAAWIFSRRDLAIAVE